MSKLTKKQKVLAENLDTEKTYSVSEAMEIFKSVKSDKFYLWTGYGGNGKGTLVTLINMAFGMYSGEMPVQILTS